MKIIYKDTNTTDRIVEVSNVFFRQSTPRNKIFFWADNINGVRTLYGFITSFASSLDVAKAEIIDLRDCQQFYELVKKKGTEISTKRIYTDKEEISYEEC